MKFIVACSTHLKLCVTTHADEVSDRCVKKRGIAAVQDDRTDLSNEAQQGIRCVRMSAREYSYVRRRAAGRGHLVSITERTSISWGCAYILTPCTRKL